MSASSCVASRWLTFIWYERAPLLVDTTTRIDLYASMICSWRWSVKLPFVFELLRTCLIDGLIGVLSLQMACLCCTEHARLIRVCFLGELGTSYWSNSSWEYSHKFLAKFLARNQTNFVKNYHPNDKTTSWFSFLLTYVTDCVILFWQVLQLTDQFTFLQTCQERPVWAKQCSENTW